MKYGHVLLLGKLIREISMKVATQATQVLRYGVCTVIFGQAALNV